MAHMNKTAANKFLSGLLRTSSPKTLIYITGDVKYLLEKASYNSIASKDFLIVDFFKIGNRQVKMFGHCSDNPAMKKCYPLSKTRWLDSAYPRRKPRDLAKVHRNNVLTTMRAIIHPQIEEFKHEWYTQAGRLYEVDKSAYEKHITCPLSGANLFHCQRKAVDHVVPFIKLAEDWLTTMGFTWSDLNPNRKRTEFKNPNHTKSWAEYHSTHGELQFTEAKANLKKSDRGR
jgi:hypothetical protein